jgi:superfamily II DNA or RNA helicase
MSIEFISLLNDLSEIIGPEERSIGRTLFDQGGVDELLRTTSSAPDVEPPTTELSARSVGESVRLQWQDDDPDKRRAIDIQASCSCNQFHDGFVCPHIWATFLRAEDQGELDAIAERRVSLLLGEPMPGIGDNDSRTRASGSDWRRFVARARKDTARRDSPTAGALPVTANKIWTFWATLDEQLCRRSGRVTLGFFRQAVRHDGSISEPLPVAPRELASLRLANERQKRASEMLRSLLAPEDAERSSLTLDSHRVEPVLRQLTRRRCLRLRSEDGTTTVLQNSADAPLSFELVLEHDEGTDSPALVTGRFLRRSSRRPLAQARFVQREGLVVFDDKLEDLELGPSDWGFLEALREAPNCTLEIPHGEIEEFLESLWTGADPPQIELPESLARGLGKKVSKKRLAARPPRVELVVRLESHRLVQAGNAATAGNGTGGNGTDTETAGEPETIIPGRHLELRLRFDYQGDGQRVFHPNDRARSWIETAPDGSRRRIERNHEAEEKAVKALNGLPNLPPRLGRSLTLRDSVSVPVQGPEVALLLASATLALEQRLGDTDFDIVYCGHPVEIARRIEGRIQSEIDWFNLEADVVFDSGRRSLPELLGGLSRDGMFFETFSETEVSQVPATAPKSNLDSAATALLPPVRLLPPKWQQLLPGLRKASASGGGGPGSSIPNTLRFDMSQLLLFDPLLSDHLDAHLELDDRSAQLRQRLTEFKGIEPAEAPAGFKGQLRAYQKTAVGWFGFLDRFRLGGCLADDMGLGKTVQVIAHLADLHSVAAKSKVPSLVVVPSSLVFNWRREIERFAPGLDVVDFTGARRDKLLDSLDDCDVIITSYGILRRNVVELAARRYRLVVLDEAQAIKNHSSRTSKAARRLLGEHRIALTGTPVENHLGEAASIFEFLNPGMIQPHGSLSALANPHQASDDEINEAAQALRPLILRRTKEQVLKDLPAKTEQTLSIDLDKDERRRYDDLLRHYQRALKVGTSDGDTTTMHVLEALLRLRQAACHQGLIDGALSAEPSSKVAVLLERIQECVEGGHKVLVFSQFTQLLALVERQLPGLGVGYTTLDGSTRNREERVDLFQNDPDCSVFLISLKAGGTGLNLTAADYVFLLDPWWNPASEAQAIDRAHRYGQKRPVFAYRLIARNTVEERIEELKQKKRDLADALLGPSQGAPQKLSREELEALLG